MTRIKIETFVPKHTEVGDARTQARIAAAQQVGLHIVEETLLPIVDQREVIDADGVGVNPVPNDSSVDRTLTTWWEFHK